MEKMNDRMIKKTWLQWSYLYKDDGTDLSRKKTYPTSFFVGQQAHKPVLFKTQFAVKLILISIKVISNRIFKVDLEGQRCKN